MNIWTYGLWGPGGSARAVSSSTPLGCRRQWREPLNYQYYYFSQYTARKNLDQKLSSPKDSLLKYNANISNKNRAGVGLLYLNDYLGNEIISNSIKEFYANNKLKTIDSKLFIDLFNQKLIKILVGLLMTTSILIKKLITLLKMSLRIIMNS